MLPRFVALGPVGMIIPVTSLRTLSIEAQYEFRHGQVQNICISVPTPVLRLQILLTILGRTGSTEALFYAACQGYNIFSE